MTFFLGLDYTALLFKKLNNSLQNCTLSKRYLKKAHGFSIIHSVKKGKTGHTLPSIMGENIRLLRGSMGLTIEKLAEKAKLSPAYMGAIERGEKWPRPVTIERIAEVLGVAAHSLFNADNRIPNDIYKLAKDLIKDFETAVGKTVKKMNSVINNNEE